MAADAPLFSALLENYGDAPGALQTLRIEAFRPNVDRFVPGTQLGNLRIVNR